LQSSFLQIDVAEIVIHKADQPNPFFDFFQTDCLTSENRAEVNLFAVETDASAADDLDGLVVERIVQFGQATIGTSNSLFNLSKLSVWWLRWASPSNASNPAIRNRTAGMSACISRSKTKPRALRA
jgi:hypothetical protein